jgi:hypothetical protein
MAAPIYKESADCFDFLDEVCPKINAYISALRERMSSPYNSRQGGMFWGIKSDHAKAINTAIVTVTRELEKFNDKTTKRSTEAMTEAGIISITPSYNGSSPTNFSTMDPLCEVEKPSVRNAFRTLFETVERIAGEGNYNRLKRLVTFVDGRLVLSVGGREILQDSNWYQRFISKEPFTLRPLTLEERVSRATRPPQCGGYQRRTRNRKVRRSHRRHRHTRRR